MSCVKCMFSGLDEELCPASGYFQCPGEDKSVQRHWYVHCPCGGTLSFNRVMPGGLEAELFPASEVCPMSVWQNSVLRDGYVQRTGCITLS
ncbi:hypothetical protein TNCV_1531221 [Trichonephila clavipes]|nr:hypothetical protein TNCV_1531221 [Trichonephila clavipes]